MTTKEQEEFIEEEIDGLWKSIFEEIPGSIDGDEEEQMFKKIAIRNRITQCFKASLERLYEKGYEQGVKDELKCVESYPKDHPHLYANYNGQLIQN